jgi:hypothetical protein
MGELAMPEAVSAPSQPRPRFTLNSDGERHPLLNAMTAFAFVAGITALVLAFYRPEHAVATILGMAAFGVGMAGQLMSATREQRVFLVAGIIAGFVGMALGIGHGGF